MTSMLTQQQQKQREIDTERKNRTDTIGCHVKKSTTSVPPILASDADNTNNDDVVKKRIVKSVVRQKLQKLRHLVLPKVINPHYLDTLFPPLLDLFDPQAVTYNGGIAKIKEWKISCYLEVMDGGVPCTNPNLQLLDLFSPLLDKCNELFMIWYQQQHSCNCSSKGSFWERRAREKVEQREQKEDEKESTTSESKENTLPVPSTVKKIGNCNADLTSGLKTASNANSKTQPKSSALSCRRLMTFITRYTPAPGEQALLKHVDGAGKVDGSCVVALPVDRWSAPYDVNSFEGYGGGLTFWDGKEHVIVADSDEEGATARTQSRPREIHYDTRSGDIAFIDKAVWHQADPITKGTRWALVIFYKVE